MKPGAAVFIALFLTGAAGAQAERVVAFVDGRRDEAASIEGRSTWTRDRAKVGIGLAGCRIEPNGKDRYFGITLFEIPTVGAKSLVVVAFLEGETESSWRLRIDDEKSKDAGKDSAIEYVTLKPGRNEIPLALEGRKTEGGRALDLSKQVQRLQISRKATPGDPAIVLDGVIAKDPAKGPGGKSLLAELAGEKDGSTRARILRERLPQLVADQDVVEVATHVLGSDEYPRARRAAREALTRISNAAALKALAEAATKAAGPARIEMLWALAGCPSTDARARAFTLAREAKSAEDRAALINGLGIAGGSDVAGLADAAPANGVWPPRAALVHSLRTAADRTAVDALIAILADPGCTRIADDAEDALVALTGNDLFGSNAVAWKDWWGVNREKVELTGKGRRKTSSYATTTFYGLAVPKGRVAFVLDTSGSMNEPVGGGKLAEYMASAKHLSPTGIRTRLDLAAAELVHAVLEMKEGSTIGVVAYSANENWITKGFEKLEPSLRDRIAQRVKSETAGRSTNIYAGLYAAFHPEKKPRETDLVDGPDTIFLLSDGNPSSGKFKDLEELRDEVLAWNLGRMIRINSVNVGNADARLLRGLANASGGTFLDLQSERRDDPKDRPRD